MIFNNLLFGLLQIFILLLCLITTNSNAQTYIFVDSVETIGFKNASLEGEQGSAKLPPLWNTCTTLPELMPDIQPGTFGVRLPAFKGKTYLSMVGHDDGAIEAIKQTLSSALKAGKCYRMSLYLAKSEKYQTQSHQTNSLALFEKPLKLILWGLSADSCVLKTEDWLAETQPIHHFGWKKYVFFIQPPKDCATLVFQVGHVADKPYNGNLLLDNISTIQVVECADLRITQPNAAGSKTTTLLIHLLNEVIINNAPQLKFAGKSDKLQSDGYNTEGVGILKNTYLDRIIEIFEKYKHYKLMIRVKGSNHLAKKRVVYLYNYMFKHSQLKAQQFDIQPFKAKDEQYIWSIETDDLALSFDMVENN